MAQSALRNLPLERMNARRERAGMEPVTQEQLASMLGGNPFSQFTSLNTPENMSLGATATDVAMGFLPFVGTAQGVRDFERARRDDDTLGMILGGLSAVPVAGGLVKAGRAVEGALDMSQAARMQRAVGQERPFDINQEWYIGTPVNIESTPEKGFRAAKTENVGRDVIFGTDSPLIAEEYSRGTVSFDEDPLTGKFPVIESNYRNQSPSGGVYRVFSGAQNPKRIDAKGKKWFELPMNQITSNAFDEGHDAVIYENIIDSMYGSSFPSNVIVWKNPSDVRSIKAAFDPSKRSSGELLASVAGGAVGLSALRQLMPQQEQE